MPKARRRTKMRVIPQERGDPPTPETLAKLRPCPLQLLYAAGVIEHDEMAAGYDLLEGKQAYTAQVDMQTSRAERRDPGNGTIGAHLVRLIECYRLWWQEMGNRRMVAWPLMDALEKYWQPPAGTGWGVHIARSLRIYCAVRDDWDRRHRQDA